MLPITKERSKELFERDKREYTHEGNTEAMVLNPKIMRAQRFFGLPVRIGKNIMEKETRRIRKSKTEKPDESS
jgi:hypothetical protein